MNNRERFHAAMSFEETDRVCHMEHGFWESGYDRWVKEGLDSKIKYPNPEQLTSSDTDLYQYFDVVRYVRVLKSQQLFYPKFKYEILEETSEYRIEKTEAGIIQKQGKTVVSLPQFLDYPIHNRQDYYSFKERLMSNALERYPENWEQQAKDMREQDYATLSTYVYGFFGYLRELMGVETLLYMFCDDPELIKEILADRVNFLYEYLEKQIKDTKPDFIFIWEDMCYKNGPLISPSMFREFMLPAYKSITSFAKSLGVKHVIVDSDGDVMQLIPLWLEGGVTGLLPFEVRAGMDIVKIGQEFPKLQIIGGIDKHEIAKGKDAIDEELNRVLPFMRKRGGFAASLDHWVPDDISFENYKYFVEKVREFK